jgi:hypothetical protein
LAFDWSVTRRIGGREKQESGYLVSRNDAILDRRKDIRRKRKKVGKQSNADGPSSYYHRAAAAALLCLAPPPPPPKNKRRRSALFFHVIAGKVPKEKIIKNQQNWDKKKKSFQKITEGNVYKTHRGAIVLHFPSFYYFLPNFYLFSTERINR